MTEKDLSKEKAFVESHRDELLKEHAGKFLLVSDEALISSYDTYDAAAAAAIEEFGMDQNFLIYHLTQDRATNLAIGAVL